MTKEELTKAAFADLFPDTFQLAGYAIREAQRQINGGNEELNVTELLNMIKKNPPESLTEDNEQ